MNFQTVAEMLTIQTFENDKALLVWGYKVEMLQSIVSI